MDDGNDFSFYPSILLSSGKPHPAGVPFLPPYHQRPGQASSSDFHFPAKYFSPCCQLQLPKHSHRFLDRNSISTQFNFTTQQENTEVLFLSPYCAGFLLFLSVLDILTVLWYFLYSNISHWHLQALHPYAFYIRPIAFTACQQKRRYRRLYVN